MEEVLNVSITDFFKHFSPEEVFGRKMAIIEINGADMHNAERLQAPVRLEAVSIIVAAKGEISVDVDYLTQKADKNSVLFLIEHCIIENIKFSHDFRGYHIVISKELVREVMSDVVKMRSEVKSPRMNPLTVIDDADTQILLEHIGRIRASISDKEHSFYKNIIRNELSTFLLQFIHIRHKGTDDTTLKQQIGHKEEIVRQFIMLVIENYKKEHEVTFYSNELCITPEYLSKILKGFNGKTANKWIADALVSEAKILLRKRDITVQQVAEELNFSDQSYFGKFFKKHTGKSPLEYRNSLLK